MPIIVTNIILKMDLSSANTFESSLNYDNYLFANSSSRSSSWWYISFKCRYVSTMCKILDLSHDAQCHGLNKDNCVTAASNRWIMGHFSWWTFVHINTSNARPFWWLILSNSISQIDNYVSTNILNNGPVWAPYMPLCK